ncbi:MAG: NUDIX hydrolase, partial [Planctomycetia bacterium]|nr:NUDIX hydrolase [Planctomycetia bacterium]
MNMQEIFDMGTQALIPGVFWHPNYRFSQDFCLTPTDSVSVLRSELKGVESFSLRVNVSDFDENSPEIQFWTPFLEKIPLVRLELADFPPFHTFMRQIFSPKTASEVSLTPFLESILATLCAQFQLVPNMEMWLEFKPDIFLTYFYDGDGIKSGIAESITDHKLRGVNIRLVLDLAEGPKKLMRFIDVLKNIHQENIHLEICGNFLKWKETQIVDFLKRISETAPVSLRFRETLEDNRNGRGDNNDFAQDSDGELRFRYLRQKRTVTQTLHTLNLPVASENFWNARDLASLQSASLQNIIHVGIGRGNDSYIHHLHVSLSGPNFTVFPVHSQIYAPENSLENSAEVSVFSLPPTENLPAFLSASFARGYVQKSEMESFLGEPILDRFSEEIQFALKKYLFTESDDRFTLTVTGQESAGGLLALFASEHFRAIYFSGLKSQKMRKTSELTTKNESAFLTTYNLEKYPRPSVTSDAVAIVLEDSGDVEVSENAQNFLKTEYEEFLGKITEKSASVLLIQRKKPPFQDAWALPGGFLQRNETAECCMRRELFEETGLAAGPILPLGCFSTPNRDPRGWILSNAFLTLISPDEATSSADDDARDARWFQISWRWELDTLTLYLSDPTQTIRFTATLSFHMELNLPHFTQLGNSGLAFDHAEILATGVYQLEKLLKIVR